MTAGLTYINVKKDLNFCTQHLSDWMGNDVRLFCRLLTLTCHSSCESSRPGQTILSEQLAVDLLFQQMDSPCTAMQPCTTTDKCRCPCAWCKDRELLTLLRGLSPNHFCHIESCVNPSSYKCKPFW